MKLDKIINPQELRKHSKKDLEEIAKELREALLIAVSKSSGHFASGLGVIELTIALHYVYNTPFDKIIWDVGHQCYPHKIITGRSDSITTIRKTDGLHPFPCISESKYDAFGVGHSSTSISAALGMAIAASKDKNNRKVVAVIGDGALTGGMAYEALNNAGELNKDILIILNDNQMSISKNVGAVNQLLSKEINEQENNKETLFDKLGIKYNGPIDGHNINQLTDNLEQLREKKGTQLLHIITTKGKGYQPAEQNPIKWHAVNKFNLHSVNATTASTTYTYSKIFGNWLLKTAANDKKVIAITPAMCEGSGIKEFAANFPEQYLDVGIAEQHSVTLAAGLALSGYKPIVAIYSTFLQRGYDQLIHDVALQKLPVVFAIDRAGIVGGDGATHQGAFDLSYLRCIPNITIMTPATGTECCNMLHTAYTSNQTTAVRYPKAKCLTYNPNDTYQAIPIGKANKILSGEKLAILNFGTLLLEAKKVAEELNLTLIDMRFVKPLDTAMIKEVAATHTGLITIEENTIHGGAGSAVIEELMRIKNPIQTLTLGLPNNFIKHGDIEELKQQLELDYQGIKKNIINFFKFN